MGILKVKLGLRIEKKLLGDYQKIGILSPSFFIQSIKNL
jgi:hypothetical protein